MGKLVCRVINVYLRTKDIVALKPGLFKVCLCKELAEEWPPGGTDPQVVRVSCVSTERSKRGWWPDTMAEPFLYHCLVPSSID